jgi:hypothetical protein
MSKDDPIVGVGHPDFQEMLSADDEKRVDEKGRAVVDKEVWSRTGTSLYLTIAACKSPLLVDRHYQGAVKVVFGDTRLVCIATMGKPVLGTENVGAALEIPSDLGDDPLKSKYVTEWIIETMKEAAAAYHLPPYVLAKQAMWMTSTVEEALCGWKL